MSGGYLKGVWNVSDDAGYTDGVYTIKRWFLKDKWRVFEWFEDQLPISKSSHVKSENVKSEMVQARQVKSGRSSCVKTFGLFVFGQKFF